MKKTKQVTIPGQFNIFPFRWKVIFEEEGRACSVAFYKEETAKQFAAQKGGKIEEASWQVRGTLVRDGKKLRLKPVFNDYQNAVTKASELRGAAANQTKVTVQDLLTTDKAKDAIKANLPDNWTFAGAVAFAKEMGYDPDLPQRTVEQVIPEYLDYLHRKVTSGTVSEAYEDSACFALKLVRLYFWDQPVHVLLNKTRVEDFCIGAEPIPPRGHYEQSRKVPRDLASETKRPWSLHMQHLVAASISAMMNGYVRGRYVSKYVMDDMFWFPKMPEFDPYVMDTNEIRNYLDGAWTVAGGRHATHCILELFGGLRPSEIDSWDETKRKGSYLNLNTGVFYVDIKRKTGCREVHLPWNARLMLHILKKEGRLWAEEIKPGSGCYRIKKTHPGTKTYFHARVGYRTSASVVKRPKMPAERFWERHPVIYEAGWIQDAPRHTCLDYYFYATNHDAGSTAGYAGHLETQFFRNYKGKLRVENIAAAVAAFYRILPAPHRQLETAKTPTGEFVVKLPFWYRIEDESEACAEIKRLADQVADLSLISHNAKEGCSVKPLNKFELIEHAWRLRFVDENGVYQSRVSHKKNEVAALARAHNIVPSDELIRFPISGARLTFVNGNKIEIAAWRVEGRVMEEGNRVWLRPVRANYEEAVRLRDELQHKYSDTQAA